ncbi:GH15708 [Drosophila grimshawi]|uniref:GH15708 n=1 Tax=Drosophila grimshawi TaxID=7222 RepID=B4IZ38_DROGR|nr:GH15708 [Drosophila grimshawi]
MFKSVWPTLIGLIMLSLCILVKAAPYQELEPRKGHVPVYIRHGNEALSQIHPGLAEAFNEENDSQSQQLKAENLITESPSTTETAKSSTESDIASFDTIKAKDIMGLLEEQLEEQEQEQEQQELEQEEEQ